MNINGTHYDGIVGKPSIDDALSHYGVKGMKWRRRKGKSSGGASQPKKQPRQKYHSTKTMSNKSKRKLNAQRLAEDIHDGRIKYEDIPWYPDGWGHRVTAKGIKDPNTNLDNYTVRKEDVDEALRKLEDKKAKRVSVGISSHKF